MKDSIITLVMLIILLLIIGLSWKAGYIYGYDAGIDYMSDEMGLPND